MTDTQKKEFKDKMLQTIEKKLFSLYTIENANYSENIHSTNFLPALNYTLLAGGKRIRPLLTLYFAKLCAKKMNINFILEDILPIATALEMVHTYSLIHDDLPAMDNDDLRRGKPTCHKAYDEATAILVGDALLTDAFTLASEVNFEAKYVLEAMRFLSKCAGSQGMIAGQILDLAMEKNSMQSQEKYAIEILREMNARKTGDLLLASCYLPCILYNVDKDFAKDCENFALNFGIAFQITDDILDIIGDAKVMGKPQGSDILLEKTTWPSLLGLENAKKMAIDYINNAQIILKNWQNSHLGNEEDCALVLEILTDLLQSLNKRTA